VSGTHPISEKAGNWAVRSMYVPGLFIWAQATTAVTMNLRTHRSTFGISQNRLARMSGVIG
jgi:hypothetical protein